MEAKIKDNWQWFLALGLAGFIFFSFIQSSIPVSHEVEEIQAIRIAGQKLNVELAMTPEARAQGLSYRAELNKKDSMLFIFDEPGDYPFWMKDMNFPIDIIWIGEDMKVVHIQNNAKPDSYPISFYPDSKAKYVLETVAGFSVKNNLKVGNKIQFDY